MNLNIFLLKLNDTPDQIEFSDTIATIDALYDFTPAEFKNGDAINATGQNNGSCKLFAFAQLQHFTAEQTLACFGAYYRDDVLKNPQGTDHQNIRNFMRHGWAGIHYQSSPLKLKQTS